MLKRLFAWLRKRAEPTELFDERDRLDALRRLHEKARRRRDFVRSGRERLTTF